ncbi:myb/SANT-like DNA-binding domain-containing protein 3 [Dermacentor albipictus]|uniref:myb/SANT-like DNA-binding domain-containing protein 3 n=1 Tax=Dermacentor albipictus TaxID=60249 RepID=UPI0031FE277E
MDLMERHRDVLGCKRTDAVSIHAKKKTREKLADEINHHHNVPSRTSKQLKKCWDNLKEIWRREKAEDTCEIFKAGGGTPADSHMGEKLLRVGAVATHTAIRLTNPLDSDCAGPGTELTPAVAVL